MRGCTRASSLNFAGLMTVAFAAAVAVRAAPVVDNDGGVSNAVPGAAQLRGTLTGGPADVRIYWGAADAGAGEGWANSVLLTNVSDGAFSCNISNLFYGVLYFYRCQASNVNDQSTAWAAETASFTTLPPATGFSYSNGLRGSMFQPTPGNATPVDMTGARYSNSFMRVFVGDKANTILAMTPSTVPAELPARNIVLQGSANAWTEFGGSPGDNFVTALSGRFFPAVSGSYNFFWNNDDRGWMFIDAGDDGVFDAGDAVGTYSWPGNGNVTLTAGRGYNFIFFAQEFGGGESLDFEYTVPNGTRAVVNPTAQAGQWRYATGTVPGLSISNLPISAYATNSAVLHAALASPQTAFDVTVYWDTVDGGSNAAQWAHSAPVGSWTNVLSTNLSYLVTGLAAETQYFFTFRATNAVEDLWASNAMLFPHTGKDFLTFRIQGIPQVVSGTDITLTIPYWMDITALSPVYTVSDFAVGAPPSGTPRDFTNPQTYTVTAEDGSSQVYTVTVIRGELPSAFYWIGSSGNWSVDSNWSNNLGETGGLLAGGSTNYSLNFNQAATVTASHDLNAGFALNQLSFGGAAATLTGNSLTFTNNGEILPVLSQNSAVAITVNNALALGTNLTVGGTGSGSLKLTGALSGAGGLTKSCAGQLTLSSAGSSYTGKTIVQAGTLYPSVPMTPAGVAGPLGAPTGDSGTIDLYNGVILQVGDTNPRLSYNTDRTIHLAGTGAGTVWIKANDNDTTFTFGSIAATGTGAKTLGLAVGWEFTGGDRTRMNITGSISDASDGSPVGLQITFRPQDAGDGKLYLYGTNTFTGPVSMSTTKITQNNTLFVDAAAQLAVGFYTNAIALGAGCTFNYSSSATQVLSGEIAGMGMVTKKNAGTLILAGTNTFSGVTTADGGTLVVSNSLALQGSTLSYKSGTLSFAGGITNFVVGGLGSSMPIGLTNAAGVSIVLTAGANGISTTNTGALTGPGSLIKVGAGTLTLSGVNTFTGATTVSNGTLRLTSTNGLSRATDVYLVQGATLALDYTNTVYVHTLYIDGVEQPARRYNKVTLPAFILGTSTGNLVPLMGSVSGATLIVR